MSMDQTIKTIFATEDPETVVREYPEREKPGLIRNYNFLNYIRIEKDRTITRLRKCEVCDSYYCAENFNHNKN